jgi:NADH-quinone oxidoreductase subunit A
VKFFTYIAAARLEFSPRAAKLPPPARRAWRGEGFVLTEYLPVVFLLFLGLAVGVAILVLSWWLGPKSSRRPLHDSPFECGIVPTGDARQRIDVKFYLVAMLFILFDVEIVFLFPWAVMFDALGGLGLFVMGEFLLILIVGYAYVWKKGALDW